MTAMSEAGSKHRCFRKRSTKKATPSKRRSWLRRLQRARLCWRKMEELNEAVPPAAGEAEDLELPDRKQIF